MKEVNILELFSGIGGFSKGIQDAGIKIKTHYFSEVDKYAIANYKYNFKESIYVGSVQDVRGAELEQPNIITFGSPCQDFSLAGKRKGMEGERSNLILEAIRLVDEFRPDIFIWENVKGAFSSNNGADFWAIIQAFTNLGNYRLEWQLLNTAWFLPQNRERIYLIGHLAGKSEPRVFPFRENDFVSNFSEKPNQRQSQAKHSTTVATKNGNRSTDTFISVPKTAGTLTAGANSGGLHSDMTTIEVGTFRTHSEDFGFRKCQSNLSPTIPSRAREDGSGQPVIKINPVLTINRQEKRQNGRRFKEDGEAAFTLNCQDQHGIIVNESSIRRLTEIECERLQGFPDNWTQFGIFENETKEISKTQRYKMIGNAADANMVKQIFNRLK